LESGDGNESHTYQILCLLCRNFSIGWEDVDIYCWKSNQACSAPFRHRRAGGRRERLERLGQCFITQRPTRKCIAFSMCASASWRSRVWDQPALPQGIHYHRGDLSPQVGDFEVSRVAFAGGVWPLRSCQLLYKEDVAYGYKGDCLGEGNSPPWSPTMISLSPGSAGPYQTQRTLLRKS